MNICTIKIKTFLASLYFYSALYPAISQTTDRPLIKVDQLEYAYDPEIIATTIQKTNWGNRVILANDTVVGAQLKLSFQNAINRRWNTAAQVGQWNLKKVDSWVDAPKFKPKLSSKDPGSWHLYFQVFDNGPNPMKGNNNFFNVNSSSFESLDSAAYNLRLKAVMLDGANGSTVFSHEMKVELQRTPFPEGQVLLRKVPGLTTSFLKNLDSAFRVFFDSTNVSNLTLPLVPAFVFISTDSVRVKALPLSFTITGDTMVEESSLHQQWVIQKISKEKLGKKEHFGDNLLSGAFTSLTGLGSQRIKEWKYMAAIDFTDNNENKKYTCKVPYLEEEEDERNREKIKHADGSKSYENQLSDKINRNRYIDPDHYGYFLDGSDTAGSFKISFGKIKEYTDQFTQCWDGKDSASIIPMPEFWNNAIAGAGMGIAPMYLQGSLFGKPFGIQTSKGGNQYDLMSDGKLIATLGMNYDLPTRGYLYTKPTDARILKAMCMISTLPFRYFNLNNY